MSSRNYGQLGRRSGSAAWQWVIIGGILGFACAATIVLAAVALGFISISGSNGVAFGPTQTPVVITATPLPVTPTLTPTEVLVTATPSESAGIAIEAPTATPTTDPAMITPTATNTVEPTATRAQVLSLNPASGNGQVPAALSSVASPLVPITGGAFQMGTTPAEAAAAVRQCVDQDGGQCLLGHAEDSYPQHEVQLATFQIETTEVTYAQYLTFLNLMGPGSHTKGCDGQPCLATNQETDTSNVNFDSANYDVPDVINNNPVGDVTWYGAKAYCEALARRLPTEAEWELAARGTDGRIYPWGNNWDPTLAWTSRSAPDDGEEGGPNPVDSFPLGHSPYGILNAAGNVAEWVQDWYDPQYYAQQEARGPNPQGPPLGDQKVIRGGSWADVPFFARTMHRRSQRPGDPTAEVGFRCAADAANAASNNAAIATPIGAEGAGTSALQNPPGGPAASPNPATLGQITGDEGDLGGSQPTLAPAPTQPAGQQPTPLPGGSTLEPG